MDLTFATIELQLVDALPELKSAAENYWRNEGNPGEDCGPYIFFEDMFGCYVETLLATRPSLARDSLLRRAFGFVEEMLVSRDGNVRDLAFIGLYEGQGPWWLQRARPFIGEHGAKELDEHAPAWRERISKVGKTCNYPRLIDLWGTREVIARELASEGVKLDDVPGSTARVGR
jgi:hypothetical protein